MACPFKAQPTDGNLLSGQQGISVLPHLTTLICNWRWQPGIIQDPPVRHICHVSILIPEINRLLVSLLQLTLLLPY